MLLREARTRACRNDWVAVIIPTHNRRELLLERALPSVLAQRGVDFSVYVMAHGCTDGTEAAVRSLDTDERRGRCVRAISVPRTPCYPPTAENHWLVGPTEPLNAGLALDHDCGWIARIDDDDEWNVDHLARLLRFAKTGNFEFVSSASRVGTDTSLPYLYPGGFPCRTPASAIPTREALVGGCATWLYRSYLSCFRYNVDAWRKRWNRNNDTDLPERMHRAGVRMGYLDEVTSYTRPRPGEQHTGSRAYLGNPSLTEDRYRF